MLRANIFREIIRGHALFEAHVSTRNLTQGFTAGLSRKVSGSHSPKYARLIYVLARPGHCVKHTHALHRPIYAHNMSGRCYTIRYFWFRFSKGAGYGREWGWGTGTNDYDGHANEKIYYYTTHTHTACVSMQCFDHSVSICVDVLCAPYTTQLDSIMSFAALFGLLSPLFGLVTDRWGSRAACFIGNWNPYRNPNPNA